MTRPVPPPISIPTPGTAASAEANLPRSASKRRFLWTSAGGALALAGCGGGSDPQPDATDAGYMVEDDFGGRPSTVPLGDGETVDAQQRVAGPIAGAVTWGDAPLAGAQVQALAWDGEVLGQGATDALGRFRIEAEARAAMRFAVAAPGAGTLAASVTAYAGEGVLPVDVNLLTTFVDRLRQRTGWSLSQAEDCAQDYLGIPRYEAMQGGQFFNPAYSNDTLLRALQASGQGLVPFLDAMAAEAAALGTSGVGVRRYPPQPLLQQPNGIADWVAGKVLDGLKSVVQDKVRSWALAGLSWVFPGFGGEPSDTDRILDALKEMDAKLNRMSDALNAIQQELREMQLGQAMQQVNKLFNTLQTISLEIRNLPRYSEGERQSESVRIGALIASLENERFWIFNQFMGCLGAGLTSGAILPAVHKVLQKKFYSKDGEQTYLAYLNLIDGYQTLLYLFLVMHYDAKGAREGVDYSGRIAVLASDAVTLSAKLHSLVPEPLPHPCFFLEPAAGRGWFAQAEKLTENHFFHWNYGYPTEYRVQHAVLLPKEVQAGAWDGQWRLPSPDEISAAFYNEARDRGRGVRDVAIANGASSDARVLVETRTAWSAPGRTLIVWTNAVRDREGFFVFDFNVFRTGWNRWGFDQYNYLGCITLTPEQMESYLPWKVFEKLGQARLCAL
jgi:hypothetical protein